ncbi:Fc receptor-like protein 5 [Sinocyclocheilus rhinocerous]|uniref:Fc receptor-like protein 5 n=1 Tax=Sinocyclocheilus rhinocerous TaxID=307959 RepID=UPI0007B903F0|nr:PREDICTED: Fc receptor-like protein 5 [Sinocyclocheilus rhinocerous]
MELSQLPLVLLLISKIHSGHTEVPRAVLSVSPQKWLTEGDPVTLICEVYGSSTGWTFSWYTLTASSDYGNHYKLLSDSSRGAGGNYTVSSAALNHTGVYVCRAERGKPAYKTTYSNKQPLWVTGVSPPVSLIISPSRAQHFTSVSLSLSCEDQRSTCTFSSITTSSTGVYWCQSESGENYHPVNITVHYTVQAVLSVSPQKWLTEGDPVTLICEVYGSSTGWTFSWYTLTASDYGNHYKLLSDSSRGAGGNYTVSSAALNHTGVYVCRAERGKPAYKTTYSNKQPLWVTAVIVCSGVSPPVSLIISPSRAQHFTSVSLSLSCEDQSNSDRWRVRNYTDHCGMEDCSLRWASQTGSTCTFSSITTSSTGVYWCQSESGENYHPVNITVHYGVILECPVHPVTEGDNLTLRCLHQHSTPLNPRADFYKDKSLIQKQTTEMIISNVSKSHEGFYYCKHSERGESPKSWISVTERPKAKVTIKPDQRVFRGETVTLRCDIDGEGVTGWQYSWYKDSSANAFSDQQEHTFRSVTESDAVGVILESPVHPVTEGDTLTLRCLHQNTSSVLRADFYKDESLIQNQLSSQSLFL